MKLQCSSYSPPLPKVSYFICYFVKITHLPGRGGQGACGKLVLAYVCCVNGLKRGQGGGCFVVVPHSHMGLREGRGAALWWDCGDAPVPALCLCLWASPGIVCCA